MYREHGQSIKDVYENDFVINGKFGRKIMDSNATRIQSTELTGMTQKMDIGARQRKTDDLYETVDAMRGSDSVKIRNYRSAVVCLVLLCILLLTAVIVLCVTLTQERQHLISKNENLTNEKDQLTLKNTNLNNETDQLILKNTNLTNDRDQLILKNTKLTNDRDQLILKNTNLTNDREQLILKKTNLTNEREQLRNELLLCVGWIFYQTSFYYMSNETKNWTESRRHCTEKGADLITINNREEYDFVQNMSGAAVVYIGLTDSDVENTWKRVDGSTLTSGFSSWASGQPDNRVDEDCAVTVAVSHPAFLNLVGWHDVACNRAFQWICEKRTS